MASVTAQPAKAASAPTKYTVADAFLEALGNAGVDYLFTVLGSDHPSIIEAYVRRQNELNKPSPKMVLFLHEFAAISAADGYARITGKPQCVIVHVDVGTAALGQGLHNASSGRAPILIFAGLAPYTLYGEQQGSRSEHVQWYQDIPNQNSLVAPYSRYSAEIKSPKHVDMMVNRALLMASTGSPGPTYLTATREVLASEAESPEDRVLHPLPTCHLGGIPQEAASLIGNELLNAERPLVVTGYLGRNHQAVKSLVELANKIKGLKVFDSEAREMSFPADHPAWVCRSTGAAPAIINADVILVLDADVPWIPTKVKPGPKAKIYHLDCDPRKERMNLFDIRATATYHADCASALAQLNNFITSEIAIPSASLFDDRWTKLQASHSAGIDTIAQKATAPPNGTISTAYLFSQVRTAVPKDTIFVSDAVTNQVPMTEQLQLTVPGTNVTKGGSGLGWAGGAAIGISLAIQKYDISSRPKMQELNRHHSSENSNSENSTAPNHLVTMIIGDGSFVFGSPTSVYWAAQTHSTPFLTIVINNGGWKATRSCLNDVHPGGLAAGTSDRGLGIELREGGGPDYGGIARAAAGGGGDEKTGLWVRKVVKGEELRDALIEGARVVREEGRGAFLDVVVE